MRTPGPNMTFSPCRSTSPATAACGADRTLRGMQDLLAQREVVLLQQLRQAMEHPPGHPCEAIYLLYDGYAAGSPPVVV